MKNDVWDKVEKVFHSALDVPPEDRSLFLQRECAGEMGLMGEVQSLLDSFEADKSILDEPVFELGLGAFGENEQKDLSGTTIGIYQLEQKIGAGGMGEVYRALDTRLNRYVALKFLSDSLENDGAAKRQLFKEAQAVAMLDHPNICAVHGIDEADGRHFIVMQYIEGTTLDESVSSRQIEIDEFDALARQMIGAVAFAHSHGVIHRDLKPGNIMVNGEGHIKVLDFGLAKVISKKQLAGGGKQDDQSQFSTNGLIIGTVAYMSPEQLRGERLDYQSDIFSVGIILYELAAKANPFERNSQAETIAAILGADPKPLKAAAPDLPPNIARIIEKCLSKNKETRFQSAAEILVELDRADVTKNNRLVSTTGRGMLFKALCAAIVLLGIWLASIFYPVDRPRRTLAVLPLSFETPQNDKEYLADGITQGIIDKLTPISDLQVKNEYFVSQFKGKKTEPQEAGKQLGVDAVYTGTIANRDNTFVLISSLVRVSDGTVIDNSELAIDEGKLIELQANICQRIVGKIKSNMSEDDRNRLAQKDTLSDEAKQLYFQGRFFLGRRQGDDLKSAERYFRDATNLDANYAKAWAGLADTYSLYSVPGYKGSMPPAEAVKSARAAAKNAMEIDDRLCEPYVSLGMIKLRYEWDWNGAEFYFKQAIARNAEFPPAYLGLSNLMMIEGRLPEALEAGLKAKEFAPFSVSSDLNMAAVYYVMRDYDHMDQVLLRAADDFPHHKRLDYFRGLQYLETGRLNEAAGVFETIYRDDKVLGAAPLGLIYGKTGRKDEARTILAALDDAAKSSGSDYIPSQEKAIINIGLGETTKAFEFLNKACDERFSALPFVLSDPIFDDLKSDPRFARIKTCVNL